MDLSRYHRQMLLPHMAEAAQRRLAEARVLLIGSGALGSVLAEQLIRAGVGFLRLIDRDIVEWTNLQRQVLFDEADARQNLPKAIAAAKRLTAINSLVKIEPLVLDVNATNVEELARGCDLLLDGTDNVQTRYLLNDVAIKLAIPWIYGACVGYEGRVMPIRPGQTPCLRCVFPEPPAADQLPTCDTAGVLAPAAAIVASLQASAALKLLSGNADAVSSQLLTIDLWQDRFHSVDLSGARRDDCPCCGRRDFQFLDRPSDSTVTLCGRNAIQIRPMVPREMDLAALAQKLAGLGTTELTPYLLRFQLHDDAQIRLTVFPDARTIVVGAHNSNRAVSLVAQLIGS